MACFIAQVRVLFDPLADFGLDSLGQQLLCALPKKLAENILSLGNWHNRHIDGRTIHGGVLLCPRGALVS
jgi:hypothetical protein